MSKPVVALHTALTLHCRAARREGGNGVFAMRLCRCHASTATHTSPGHTHVVEAVALEASTAGPGGGAGVCWVGYRGWNACSAAVSRAHLQLPSRHAGRTAHSKPKQAEGDGEEAKQTACHEQSTASQPWPTAGSLFQQALKCQREQPPSATDLHCCTALHRAAGRRASSGWRDTARLMDWHRVGGAPAEMQ